MVAVAVCALAFVVSACGDSTDEPAAADSATTLSDDDMPQIVVTTNILGDIVSQAVGELADVEVIMPIGADPHDFAPSAKQAEAMENADLLVVNGAGFEEGMGDIIDSVEESGTPVFSFADQVELLDLDGAADPHIWTDPTRMITAVEAFGGELSGLEGIDAGAATEQVSSYVAELTALDSEMETTLASIPADQRVLITNHEVFGYFADRFGFEVVGALIPSLSTSAEPSAAEIDALAELIRAEGIPAIFGDTSGSTQLADALAESVGNEVQVVVLFSESLGEPGSGADTYIGMMTTNATLISQALAPA
jgi:zinc/manganese transport system substrate-binding protein